MVNGEGKDSHALTLKSSSRKGEGGEGGVGRA